MAGAHLKSGRSKFSSPLCLVSVLTIVSHLQGERGNVPHCSCENYSTSQAIIQGSHRGHVVKLVFVDLWLGNSAKEEESRILIPVSRTVHILLLDVKLEGARARSQGFPFSGK